MHRLWWTSLAVLILALSPTGFAQASKAGCVSPTTAIEARICSEPALSDLHDELDALVARRSGELAQRPQRLRNFVARQQRWAARVLPRCGEDTLCLGTRYVERIDEIRREMGLPPTDSASTLAALGAPAARPVQGGGTASADDPADPLSEREPDPLLGHWAGPFDCAGHRGTFELSFAPGFAGTVIGFLGITAPDRSPLDAVMRDDVDILETGTANVRVANLGGGKYSQRSPGLQFSNAELSGDPASGALSVRLVEEVGCQPFAIERTTGNGALAALLDALVKQPRPQWHWPHDPDGLPSAEDAAFGRQFLAWTRPFYDHYPPATAGAIGADHIMLASVNMLDDEAFLSMAGGRYDEISSEARLKLGQRAQRTFLNNRIMRRALRLEPNSFFAVLNAREGTVRYDAVIQRLGEVRAARQWLEERRSAIPLDAPNAESYPLAVAALNDAETRIAVLLPGQISAFKADLDTAKRQSAVLFARREIFEKPIPAETDLALAEIGRRVTEVQSALADMTPEDAEVLLAEVRQREDAFIEDVARRQAAALDGFGEGIDAVKAGRRWYGDLIARYGPYRSRPAIAALLGAFADQRRPVVAAHAAEIASMIAAADDTAAFAALGETIIIPEIDREVPGIAAALEERRAYFLQQEVVANYSPYEKSLADRHGVIAVPARYSEPTDEEISLAMAREYGAYGGANADGSFNYGLIPEGSVKMQIVGARKAGCTPAEPTGYVCARELQVRFGMSDAMRGVLDGSAQGQLMESMLDYANSVELRVVEDTFVLTPGGWRSPTLARAAAKGIENSMQAVTEVGARVSCNLTVGIYACN